jgi:ribosomal protein S8
MLIKHAQPNELRNLLSILQRACKNDRLFVTFTKKKYNYIIILKLLYEQGFIQSFEEKGNFLIIRLKQTH